MKTKKVKPEKNTLDNREKDSYINSTLDFMLYNLTDYQFNMLRLEILEYIEKEKGAPQHPCPCFKD